jgi:hypothetical protein
MIDYVEKLNYLRSICEPVDTFVTTQLIQVKYSSEDEISDQTVLNEAYFIIFDELRYYGIFMYLDYPEAVENYYDAEGYAALLEFLNRNTLIDQFRLYPELHIHFEAMFDSKDINEEDYFASFLTLYKLKFTTNQPLIEKIERIQTLIYSNVLFKNYILNILESAVPASTFGDEEDVEKTITFVQSVVNGQQQFKQVVESIYSLDPSLDKDYLTKSINEYDMEKVTGTTIAKFRWAVMSKEEDLSDKEQEQQKLIINQHKYHNSHHIEYYILRKLRPTKENMVELTAHHAEPDTTITDFKNEVSAMIQQGLTNKILDPKEDTGYIKRLAQFIEEHCYRDGTIIPVQKG